VVVNAQQFIVRTAMLAWSCAGIAAAALGWSFVAAPVVALTALPSAFRAGRVLAFERRLNVDILDTIAIAVALLRGQMVTAAVITWMISLGDWIRDRTAARSKRAIKDLLEFNASTAWVVEDGKVLRVPADHVRPGQLVIVYPGEMIPVDGEVTAGRAAVDQKTVTGESLPVDRSAGDTVFACTLVREGKLTVRAVRVGAETTAAQIVRLVESAPVGETRIQNYAEKWGDRLVAPTLLLSGGLYAATGNVNRLLSMLIVDYGTGIRVAAPTAVLAAMTHAARQGILIKTGRHLERLATLDTVVFDKTGTLTHGRPEIHDVISFDERHFPPRKIVTLAAAAEARFKHPVSEAIVAKAQREGLAIPERIGSEFEIGLGVEARINGYFVHIGSERFFDRKSIALNGVGRDVAALNQRGWSALLFAVDGVLKGIIPYADQVRAESRAVLHTLRNRGLRELVMITGDNRTVAGAVAQQLGLNRYHSDTLPSDKAEIVRELQRSGRSVAMVGDGINDSPALAHADVGISMKHGADVARETADIVLMEDNLWKLIAAFDVSRDAMANIRQNYAIIAFLNTLALMLAIPSGLVGPTTAAALSNGSAILASLNAIRPVLRY
jgi:Cu2+-exporting ATPase